MMHWIPDPDRLLTRVCSKCGEEKHLMEFHVQNEVGKRRPDRGWEGLCGGGGRVVVEDEQLAAGDLALLAAGGLVGAAHGVAATVFPGEGDDAPGRAAVEGTDLGTVVV